MVEIVPIFKSTKKKVVSKGTNFFMALRLLLWNVPGCFQRIVHSSILHPQCIHRLDADSSFGWDDPGQCSCHNEYNECGYCGRKIYFGAFKHFRFYLKFNQGKVNGLHQRNSSHQPGITGCRSQKNWSWTPFSSPCPEPSRMISIKIPQVTLNPVRKARSLFLRITLKISIHRSIIYIGWWLKQAQN